METNYIIFKEDSLLKSISFDMNFCFPRHEYSYPFWSVSEASTHIVDSTIGTNALVNLQHFRNINIDKSTELSMFNSTCIVQNYIKESKSKSISYTTDHFSRRSHLVDITINKEDFYNDFSPNIFKETKTLNYSNGGALSFVDYVWEEILKKKLKHREILIEELIK